MSVSFFVGSRACHLWALLLCFLVCFDVFGALFFGNHAVSSRAVFLRVEQSSEERRQPGHQGPSRPEREAGGPRRVPSGPLRTAAPAGVMSPRRGCPPPRVCSTNCLYQELDLL